MCLRAHSSSTLNWHTEHHAPLYGDMSGYAMQVMKHGVWLCRAPAGVRCSRAAAPGSSCKYCETFFFLGCSQGQLKERACYMIQVRPCPWLYLLQPTWCMAPCVVHICHAWHTTAHSVP